MPDLTGVIVRFPSFLNEARPLLAVPGQSGQSSTLELTAASLLLEELREPVSRARSQGHFANPWKMSGIGTDEVRNCAVLAALWDQRALGDLARHFLSNFLDCLEPPRKRVPSFEELREGYTVRTEHCPLGLANDRVDITVETRTHVICIEIKIHAPEGHRQVERYLAAAEQWAQRTGKSPVVVFLAPWQNSRPNIFPALWSEIAYAARKTILTDNGTVNPGRWLLASFAQHISTFEDK